MMIIDQQRVAGLLDAGTCTCIMEETLRALEAGKGTQYLRSVNYLPSGDILGFMPACLTEDYFGGKVITVFPGNHGTEYPSHMGSILLFEAVHGSLVAIVDATSVTQIRTGAVSAVATKWLAREDARILTLIGCGAQAVSHLRAIRQVRPLEKVLVWDPSVRHSSSYCSRMEEETGLPVLPCASAKEAAEQADIICTLTPSAVPVLENSWVKPGTHINAVGACLAKNRELPSDLVARSRLYCDSLESIHNEGGDFLIPKAEGLIGNDHIVGTVGALSLGRIPGRQDNAEVTVFEALGLAIEDLAAAKYIYEKNIG